MLVTMSSLMARAQAPAMSAAESPSALAGIRRVGAWLLSQWRSACFPAARGQRVILLLLATTLMCLGDLAMTMDHARTIGLFEANPLAREVLRHHSPEVLLLFKGGSILLGCSLLFHLRKARIAELGSWAALAAMTLLCLHWNGYSQGLAEMTPQYSAMASGDFVCDTWVYWGP